MRGVWLGALLLLLSVAALAEPSRQCPWTARQVFADARPFLHDFRRRETRFFRIARQPVSGLTYDGWWLDPRTGDARLPRPWSAPSKESLDIGLCVKALEGGQEPAAEPTSPLPYRLLRGSFPFLAARAGARAPLARPTEAVAILAEKLASYRRWNRAHPEYGGFMPWFYLGAETVPTRDWVGRCPGLDNGEWAWALLDAEWALRRHGDRALADGYARYLRGLEDRVVPMFYDAAAGKVRGDVSVGPGGRAGGMRYLTGEHGVHEGAMMVLFVSLFGRGLPRGAVERIGRDIRMVRVETPYGTTWQGYWGSAHESWSYLFLPWRDVAGYRELFRIREIIRSQNAAHRGYPGLAASINSPTGDAYLSAAGIEGVGSQPVEHNDVFAPYGAFPMLLEFAGQVRGNYGLAWLANMLRTSGMYGPLGGGESATNDGRNVAWMKTIDGTFPILLAMSGGLERETEAMLKATGRWPAFVRIAKRQYDEAFGDAPLRAPVGFALPPREAGR